MDRTALTARIQEILRGRKGADSRPPSSDSGADEALTFAWRCAADEVRAEAADLLGGTLANGPSGPCLVIDRVYGSDYPHGSSRIECLAADLDRSARSLPLLSTSRNHVARLPLDPFDDVQPADLLFFDLETTGLSGGAGTCAFLVGFGWFAGDRSFNTRQFFLRSYGEERALLDVVAGFLARCGGTESIAGESGGCRDAVLVTYNGRTFDLPLMETRFLMHRLQSPFEALRHIDMLHPARRLWRRRESASVSAEQDDGTREWSGQRRPPARMEDLSASCALTVLEQDILGFRREGDVPGFEIPARYFHFARTGDARGLEAVVEHNRLDLLSLAAVTSVALRMVGEGSGGTRAPLECLGLGRLYEGAGRMDEAAACYRHVAESVGNGNNGSMARVEGMRRLAFRLHREHQHGEAAEMWKRLLAAGADERSEREACEALAIYHEHRSRDLESALRYAGRALASAAEPATRTALRHRLERIERKMGRCRQRPDEASLV